MFKTSKLGELREGIQPDGRKGVQPTRSKLDRNNPPKGGTGVAPSAQKNNNNIDNNADNSGN